MDETGPDCRLGAGGPRSARRVAFSHNSATADAVAAMLRLRDAHFFRKVPRDVSEATSSGGIISIFAMLTIGWLVWSQWAEYRTPHPVTQLRLDRDRRGHSLSSRRGVWGGDTLRINFNITMSHMPCQFASLQVTDHVGSRILSSNRNVHKVRISRTGQPLGMFEPHKYTAGSKTSMAAHVFPWHTKEGSQGDEEHRQQVEGKDLSEEQKATMAPIDSTMKGSTAKMGRRLLAIPEPNARPAAAGGQPGGRDAKAAEPDATPADAPAAGVPRDATPTGSDAGSACR